jgi:hypothetical protein
MYPRIPCEGIREAQFGNHCKYSTKLLNGSWLFYRLIYLELNVELNVFHPEVLSKVILGYYM